jgi:hypothetical protein
MSRTRVDLANNALSYLVRDTIRSLDGAQPAAVHTKQHMDLAIETVIEEHDWASCRVVNPLVQVTGVALRGWSFVYEKPADAIKIWRLENSQGQPLLRFEEGMSGDLSTNRSYIFANEANAQVRYGSNRVTVDRLSPFVFALCGLKLASLCCMALVKDAKLHKYLEDTYKLQVSKVRTSASFSEPELVDTEFVPELIQVRQ